MLSRITENISYEQVSEHVGLFEINRPKALNAMSYDFLIEAHQLLDDMESDLSIRAVVISGAGSKSFSAGGDLREEMKNSISDHAKLFRYNELGGQFCLKILRSRLPFVAAVNGYAFGAPLALIGACDLSLASEEAVFGLPTSSLGGIPGWGCTQIVARHIGAHNVKRMLLLNEWLDAAEARRVGLISKVLPASELRAEALAMAEKIAQFPPAAMTAVKQTVNQGLDLGGSLEDGLALEHEYLKECNVSPVFAEGIAALLEKRPPKFDEVDDIEQRKRLYLRLAALTGSYKVTKPGLR